MPLSQIYVSTAQTPSDYTLLALDELPPQGAVYLGWNNTPVADVNGTPLYRISHPSGAPQGYSEHEVDTSRGTCRSWPRGPWIYSEDTFGATEGGSSGSPVVNVNGQIVGQLSGACGYNVSDECDSVANATVDGAFAAYFDQVSQWLDVAPSGDNQAPTAEFTYTTSGLTSTFTDTSTDPDPGDSIESWDWNFGDTNSTSNTSTLTNPSHLFSGSGTYTVQLNVSDGEATDSFSTSVTVDDGTSPPLSGTVGVDSIGTCTVTSGRRGKSIVSFPISINPTSSGAAVSGTWGGLAKGSGSCTTDGGVCTVTKNNIRGTGKVTFTVTGVELTGYTFDGVSVVGSCTIQ